MTLKSLREKVVSEWDEFKAWAFKSWTVLFNLLVALFGVFSETFSILNGVIPKKTYAALFIAVPMINFLLRIKTQRKHDEITAAIKADERVTKAEAKAIG